MILSIELLLMRYLNYFQLKNQSSVTFVGVRAGGGGGGARGAAALPNFGQLRFFGQQGKIWAKPVFKDVSMFILLLF